MKNKLFHRLIATFVLITVSIPDITLADDHQPQTWVQSCSQAFTPTLYKDYFDDEQQAKLVKVKQYVDDNVSNNDPEQLPVVVSMLRYLVASIKLKVELQFQKVESQSHFTSNEDALNQKKKESKEFIVAYLQKCDNSLKTEFQNAQEIMPPIIGNRREPVLRMESNLLQFNIEQLIKSIDNSKYQLEFKKSDRKPIQFRSRQETSLQYAKRKFAMRSARQRQLFAIGLALLGRLFVIGLALLGLLFVIGLALLGLSFVISLALPSHETIKETENSATEQEEEKRLC